MVCNLRTINCVITEVHILGSSLIKNLKEHLLTSRGARGVPFHFNMDGIPGLGLSGLKPLVDKNLNVKGQGFVLIHAGANDIGKLPEKVWLSELECVLAYIRVRYPGYQPVWSDMLPRNKWRHGPKTGDEIKKMKIQEGCRKRLQRRARQMFGNHGGTVVHHPSLQQNFELLSPIDGVHLTQQGQADFWGDFLNFIHNI